MIGLIRMTMSGGAAMSIFFSRSVIISGVNCMACRFVRKTRFMLIICEFSVSTKPCADS